MGKFKKKRRREEELSENKDGEFNVRRSLKYKEGAAALKTYRRFLTVHFLSTFMIFCSTVTPAAGAQKTMESKYTSPRQILETFSPRKKQIWVVGYVNSTLEDSIKDLEVSFENGADAIVFESSDYKKLDSTLGEIRKKFPKHVIGVNLLGPDSHLYTYKETFALAKKHKLQIAWTDFAGVDLINEAPEVSLQAIDSEKPENVFYVSGIHMKYSTLKDPKKQIEKSALQAMGWVDGIVITGPKTGVPTDPERARRVRSVIGDYPMGAASGVSAENVQTILKYIDYTLVNTSIADKNHRVIGEKVRALRAAMDQNTVP